MIYPHPRNCRVVDRLHPGNGNPQAVKVADSVMLRSFSGAPLAGAAKDQRGGPLTADCQTSHLSCN